MKKIRNSLKAIIIKNNKLLVTKNYDVSGDWFLLPGGGQKHEETFFEALKRECLEEIGIDVNIKELCLVREYIAKNHEFAKEDAGVHQVEFMFKCEISQEPVFENGTEHDQFQTGILWIPLEKIHDYRLYPSVLKDILKNDFPLNSPIYIGDVN